MLTITLAVRPVLIIRPAVLGEKKHIISHEFVAKTHVPELKIIKHCTQFHHSPSSREEGLRTKGDFATYLNCSLVMSAPPKNLSTYMITVVKIENAAPKPRTTRYPCTKC